MPDEEDPMGVIIDFTTRGRMAQEAVDRAVARAAADVSADERPPLTMEEQEAARAERAKASHPSRQASVTDSPLAQIEQSTRFATTHYPELMVLVEDMASAPGMEEFFQARTDFFAYVEVMRSECDPHSPTPE